MLSLLNHNVVIWKYDIINVVIFLKVYGPFIYFLLVGNQLSNKPFLIIYYYLAFILAPIVGTFTCLLNLSFTL